MSYIVCEWLVHCWFFGTLDFPGGEQEWTHTTGELPLGVGTGWRWVQLVWWVCRHGKNRHGKNPRRVSWKVLLRSSRTFTTKSHTKRSVSGGDVGLLSMYSEKWWFATVFSLAQKCFHGDHPFFRIIPSTTSNEPINHPSNRRELEW